MKISDFKKLIPESSQNDACLQLCERAGIVAWRANTGATKYEYEYKTGIRTGTKGQRYVRYGMPGLPDICGYLKGDRILIRGDYCAQAFFWETKRHGKKVTHGSDQEAFLKKATLFGCLCGSGTSDDLEAFLKGIGLLR